MATNEKNTQLEIEKRLLSDIKDLKVGISIEDEKTLRKDKEWLDLQEKKSNLITNIQKNYEQLISLTQKMGVDLEDILKYEQNKRKIEQLTKQIEKFGDTQRDAITKQIENLEKQNNQYDDYLKKLGLTQKQQDKLFRTAQKHLDVEDELGDIKDRQLLVGDKLLVQEKEQNKIIEQRQSKLKAVTGSVEAIGRIGKDIFDTGKKILDPWIKVNDAVGVYQRRIGGTRQGMAALEKQVLDVATQTARKFGATGDVLLKLQQGYNEEIGRSFTLSEQQQGDIAAMNRLMGEGTAIAISSNLEKFGVGVDDIGDRITDMFNDSTKKGIVFSKVSKTFADNIKLAQNYTFKRGLESFRSMAEYSTKMRLDMQSVAAFADKVSTPEGAIDAAANLQVLGGSFAQFANPMSMLYEGLNDFEGLGQRMNDMVAKLGRWNAESGEVEFSSFNRQRIKAASQAMGVDYGSMMENAQTNARRDAIGKALTTNYDDDLRELIMNTGQYDKKNRNWYVTDNQGQKKDINSLDSSIRSTLQSRTNSTEKNVQDIAIMVKGISETFGDIQSGADSYQAKWMSGIGNFVKGIAGQLGSMPETLKFISATQLASIVVMMGANTIGNFRGGLGRGIGGKVKGGKGATTTTLGTRGKPYIHNGKPLYGAAAKSASGAAKAAKIAKFGKIGGGIAGGLLSAGATAMEYGAEGSFNKNSGKRNEAWGGTIGAGVGGAAGAVIGQALIPIPVVGALIGGYIGQWLGKKVGAAGGRAIDKNKNKYRIDKFDSSVENANFIISNGTFSGQDTIEYGQGGLLKGPSHMKGGMSVAGTNISVEGGEFVVNKKATANNLEILKAINGNKSPKIIPTEPFGKILSVSENRNGVQNNVGAQDISIKPIDIRINGTIRVEGGGKSVDISSDVLDNPIFISKLTDEITKQMSINQHGGLRKEDYKQKWSK